MNVRNSLTVFFSFITAIVLISLAGCEAADSGGGGSFSIVSNEQGEVVERIVPVAEPEAAEANDTSDLGVYKGTLSGSSGSYKVNLNNNGDNVYRVYWQFDGTSGQWDLNEIDNAAHTYSYDPNGDDGDSDSDGKIDSDYFKIVLDGSGTITSVEINFASHPEPIAINGTKETSDKIIKVFEGIAYDDAGVVVATWNMTKEGNELKAGQSYTSFANAGTNKYYIDGDVDAPFGVSVYTTRGSFDGLFDASGNLNIAPGGTEKQYKAYITGCKPGHETACNNGTATYYDVIFDPSTLTNVPPDRTISDTTMNVTITYETESTLGGTWERYNDPADPTDDSSGTWSGVRVQ